MGHIRCHIEHDFVRCATITVLGRHAILQVARRHNRVTPKLRAKACVYQELAAGLLKPSVPLFDQAIHPAGKGARLTHAYALLETQLAECTCILSPPVGQYLTRAAYFSTKFLKTCNRLGLAAHEPAPRVTRFAIDKHLHIRITTQTLNWVRAMRVHRNLTQHNICSCTLGLDLAVTLLSCRATKYATLTLLHGSAITM